MNLPFDPKRTETILACRLAIDHSLGALAVAGSSHGDLGRGAFNFAKISLAELD
jgi:hypothetical protein